MALELGKIPSFTHIGSGSQRSEAASHHLYLSPYIKTLGIAKIPCCPLMGSGTWKSEARCKLSYMAFFPCKGPGS